MTTSPATAKLLDREFLDIRSKLIDLAASFDRIQRAPGTVADDPRMDKIIQAQQILAARRPACTEQIQILFSLPYDEHWR